MVKPSTQHHIDEAIRTAVEDVSTDRITNWCKHIRTRQVSVSPLGEMMNLPIGSKEVSCSQVSGGYQGMTYRGTAGLFISTNCPTCPFHQLVAVTNIGQEIVDDVRAQESETDSTEAARAAIQHMIVDGVDVDDVLAADVESDAHVKSLVGLLADQEHKSRAAHKLREVSRHFPERISPVAAKAMTGAFLDWEIGDVVMETVRLLASSKEEDVLRHAIDAARSAMSRGINTNEAAMILDLGLVAGLVEPTVQLATLILSHLAPPVEPFEVRVSGAPPNRTAVGKAFARLAAIDYEAAAQAAGRAVISEHTFMRGAGAAGVVHLVNLVPESASIEFADPLVSGLAMLDEQGDTDASLQLALATCIGNDPERVADRLFERLPGLDSDVKTIVVRAFVHDESVESKKVPWMVRFIGLLADSSLDHELRLALSEDIGQLARNHGSTLWPHFDTMLGVLALVAAEADAIRATRPKDDQVVTSQEFLEYEARSSLAHGMVSRMNSALARVALLHPDHAVERIDELLKKSHSAVASSLKAGLLTSLGEVGQYDKAIAPSIVPIVYSHLLDPVSQQVRAAAAEACEHLLTWNRDLLPQDVLLIVASLLRDEYVQPVRGRAVRVFNRAKVSDVRLAAQILGDLYRLYLLYGEQSTGVFLARDIASSMTNLAQQHESFVPTVVSMLREMSNNSYYYTAKDIVREFGWFVQRYVQYQGSYTDTVIDYYERFQLLTSLGGHQYLDGPDDNTFENLYKLEPQVVLSRAGKIMRFARESRSDRNLRHVGTLLITVHLYEEAAEMFAALAEVLPDERRSDVQKNRYGGIASALKAEVALTDGHLDDAKRLFEESSELLKAGRAPKRKLPFDLGDIEDEAPFYEEWVQLRLEWLDLPDDAASLENRADNLAERISQLLQYDLNERESRIVGLAAATLRVASMLGRWWTQILAGDPTNTASRDAALARLAEAQGDAAAVGNEYLATLLPRLSEQISILTPTSGIKFVAQEIRLMALPFPRYDLPVPREWRARRRELPHAEDRISIEESAPPSVAVARILVDGHEPAAILTLVANRLYDIEVQIDVANVPSNATHLYLRPVSSLRLEDYTFPSETIRLDGSATTYRFAGQMMFPIAQSEGSQPLSVKLLAKFVSDDEEPIGVELFGQRELGIKVYAGPERFRARGPAASQAVDKLRTRFDHLVPSAGDPNREDEMEVAQELANYMDFQIREALFRGDESEKDLENSLMQYLRARLQDRDDVYRQVYTGAGRIDCLILGVPVELKVIKEGDLDAFIHGSIPQVTQYVVNQGRLAGFLVVLDCRPRDTASPPIVDDVDVRPGQTEQGLAPVPDGALAIGVIIVRAQVTVPSELMPPAPR